MGAFVSIPSGPVARPVRHVAPPYISSLPSLEGRTIAITGSTSGTGLALARVCAVQGARVILLNRPSTRADAAIEEISALAVEHGGSALFLECDLSILASVHSAGAALLAILGDAGGLDVLCCNAGVMACPDERTVDGFDIQMQSNHLGHFLLTHLLWPLLVTAAAERGEARVVMHTSNARRSPSMALTKSYFTRSGAGTLGGDGWPGISKWRRYQQAELANLLFAFAARDRAPGDARVKFLAAHPGTIDTGLHAKSVRAGATRLLDRFILWRALRYAGSAADGAHGLIRACVEGGVADGAFFGPAVHGGPAVELPTAPERSPQEEALLWEASAAATGAALWGGVGSGGVAGDGVVPVAAPQDAASDDDSVALLEAVVETIDNPRVAAHRV